jgi:hypothetical protein
MWLVPSFEILITYTPYIKFLFNFVVVFVVISIKICIHFCAPLFYTYDICIWPPALLLSFLFFITTKNKFGRTVVQAVSRRLPTAATRLRSQARSCGFCDGQSGNGMSYLGMLQFPMRILIPLTTPHSLIILSFDAIYLILAVSLNF